MPAGPVTAPGTPPLAAFFPVILIRTRHGHCAYGAAEDIDAGLSVSRIFVGEACQRMHCREADGGGVVLELADGVSKPLLRFLGICRSQMPLGHYPAPRRGRPGDRRPLGFGRRQFRRQDDLLCQVGYICDADSVTRSGVRSYWNMAGLVTSQVADRDH
jgi:hypothetical protein